MQTIGLAKFSNTERKVLKTAFEKVIEKVS